jgi:hypothetical protein
MHAHVTPSAIEFDKTAIDFGFVSVFESAVTSVKLTNTSALPQRFGFVDLPPYCSVQPGDGFGTLLPFESLSVDVIFRFVPIAWPLLHCSRRFCYSVCS